MNRIELIELAQQHHSHMGETEVLKLVNRAIDDFTSETEILKKNKDIYETVAGQRYYFGAADELYSSNIGGDTDIIRVLNVWIDDVLIPRLVTKNAAMLIDDDEHQGADNPLSTPSSTSNERYWYTLSDNGVRLGLVEKSTNAITRDDKTSNFQSISESGLQIRLHYISRGTHLTAGSTSGSTYIPEIPTMFHEALTYKAIAIGYKDPRNMKLDAAQYFDSEYLTAVKKAKKQARSNFTTTGFIVPCDY